MTKQSLTQATKTYSLTSAKARVTSLNKSGPKVFEYVESKELPGRYVVQEVPAPEVTVELTPVKTARSPKMMTIDQVEALNLPLLDGIKKYATEHYTAGWDVIVEAYSDEDILATIGRTKSLKGALVKLFAIVKATKEQADEVAYESVAA